MKSKVEIQNHLNIPESKEDMVQMLTEFNVLVDFLASNIDMISTKHFFVYQGGGHTAMKKYNYFYNGQPIPKAQFLQAVPENWESEVVDGEYSWGYYRATEIEE